MLPLGQSLVQTPEHLHDTQSGCGHGVREVTSRRRHTNKQHKHTHHNNITKTHDPFFRTFYNFGLSNQNVFFFSFIYAFNSVDFPEYFMIDTF